MKKVICTNAKACKKSGCQCIHNIPHEREDPYGDVFDEKMFCTEWDECYMGEAGKKVRCTKVKK